MRLASGVHMLSVDDVSAVTAWDRVFVRDVICTVSGLWVFVCSQLWTVVQASCGGAPWVIFCGAFCFM